MAPTAPPGSATETIQHNLDEERMFQGNVKDEAERHEGNNKILHFITNNSIAWKNVIMKFGYLIETPKKSKSP